MCRLENKYMDYRELERLNKEYLDTLDLEKYINI